MSHEHIKEQLATIKLLEGTQQKQRDALVYVLGIAKGNKYLLTGSQVTHIIKVIEGAL